MFPWCAALAGLGALLLCTSVAAEPLSLEIIGEAFGIDDDDVAALREGKRVGGALEHVRENELSLSIALKTARTPGYYWERHKTGSAFSSDPTVIQYGALAGDPAASLAKLELPEEEIALLAEAEPGKDLNVSTREIAQLNEIAAAVDDEALRREALLEGFRAILLQRLEAYRRGGLGAVEPYDRGDGRVGAPAVELGRALGELHATSKLAPRAYGALLDFPEPPPEGIESRFYWVVNGAEDELLVSLLHRVSAYRDGHMAVIERRFYVHRTVNCLQAVAVIAPVEDGSVVIYANRTFTDHVAGFAAPVARGIGRTIMRSKINELFDEVDAEAESDPAPAGGGS
jgi:hypothetical protein